MRYDQIVFEAQRIARNPGKLTPSAPSQQHLYHGTPMTNLGAIIRSDRLMQGAYWHKPGEPHGVRCTRSLAAAKTFAFEQEFPGGILVLNWPKLAQRYKTIQHTDTRYNDVDPTQPGEAWGIDEAEEVILTAAVRPLSAYLETVLMQAKELRELRAGEYLSDDWIDAFSGMVGYTSAVHRRNIQALMDYPNIRTI
jgi:hypothetical protein